MAQNGVPRLGLESLPNEMLTEIFDELDGEFLPIIHTSRKIRNTFLDNKSLTQRQLMQSLEDVIDDRVFPLALALGHAETTTWQPTPTPDGYPACNRKVIEFCDKYLESPCSFDMITEDLSVELVLRILGFHRIAQNSVPYLAATVGKSPETIGKLHEETRFMRCIYIYELARVIIPYRIPGLSGEDPTALLKFWFCFAPWEAGGMQVLEQCIRENAKQAVKRSLAALSIAHLHMTPSHKNHNNTHTYCLKNPEGLETGAADLAARVGVRALPLLEGDKTLPLEFFELSKNMCCANDSLTMRTSVWDGINKHYRQIWYPAGPRRVRDIIAIAERFWEPHDRESVPMRMWLWSQIFRKVHGWPALEERMRRVNTMFFTPNGGSSKFGFPYMGQYSLLDGDSMLVGPYLPQSIFCPYFNNILLRARGRGHVELPYQSDGVAHRRLGELFISRLRRDEDGSLWRYSSGYPVPRHVHYGLASPIEGEQYWLFP